MKFKILVITSILCIGFLPIIAQSDFYKNWDASNPIDKASTLDSHEKVRIYLDLLTKAEVAQDSLKIFQLNGHLSTHYLRQADYASATYYINRAHELALLTDNVSWKSWVLHIKGTIASRLIKYEESLQFFLQAVDLCKLAKDSFCLAINLEHVGSKYAKLDDFDRAAEYLDLALPMVRRHGAPRDWPLSLNNAGIFYSVTGHPLKAIPYFEQAIVLYDSLNLKKERGKCMNNLADAYRRLKRFKDSELMYEKCISFNHQWNIVENLISNYSGMFTLAEDQGDFESATEYLSLFYELRDSLVGVETHEKIARLELDFNNQQKDLEIEKNKVELITTKQSLHRRTNIIIWMTSLIGIAILLWWWRNRMVQQKMADQQKTLADTTKLLLDKNRQLVELKKQLHETIDGPETGIGSQAFDVNMFDIRILTDTDWKLFQSNFERAYPAYIRRLRKRYPSMTEAEERLFLFIKLNLTKKEVAAILGISTDSVKRTRNRLRKRIGLEENQNLEQFVINF